MPGKSVYLETFGCQMNELDSQLVTSQLRALGYRFTQESAAADVVLYNTCSVREHAEQKVWSRLGELALRKAREPQLVVGVLGCMAEREGEALLKRMPVVDILIGPGDLDKLPGLLDNAVRTRASMLSDYWTLQLQATPEDEKPDITRLASAGQVALQGNTSRRSATLAAAADSLELLDLSRAVDPDDRTASAYVRITRGCNKFCTYCVVPFTRGAEVHRPPQHIIDECRKLADAGVIEITLLGQTVNHYRFEHGSSVTLGGVLQPQKGRVYKSNDDHRDAYAGERVTTFADLLREIHDACPSVKRLRFVTSYPRSFGNDVLQVIRDHPRICRYLHVPAQTGSDRLLKSMNRGYTVAEYLDFIDRARAMLHQPEIGRPLTIAGDIIVGFPGETEEDFIATRSLMERVKYKNCFIFKYSPRPGTIAHDKLPDDVPDEIKRRRNAELLDLQNIHSAEVCAEYVGSEIDVFVQSVSKRDAKKLAKPTAAKGAITLTIGGSTVAQPGTSCIDNASHITHTTDAVTLQLSARTDGDLIVFFDAPRGVSPDDLIGTIQRVRIDRAEPLALHASL